MTDQKSSDPGSITTEGRCPGCGETKVLGPAWVNYLCTSCHLRMDLSAELARIEGRPPPPLPAEPEPWVEDRSLARRAFDSTTDYVRTFVFMFAPLWAGGGAYLTWHFLHYRMDLPDFIPVLGMLVAYWTILLGTHRLTLGKEST